jgi:hypothetical protein
MSRSMCMAQFVGTRVAGKLTWVPAHIKPNGDKVGSRVEITAYANGKRKDPKTGERKKKKFRYVVWGPMADTCCKSLRPGRQISVFAEPDPYMGVLYNPDFTPRLDITGKEILVEKTSYTVFDLLFGNDSRKQIATEKQDGRRPLNWDNEAHSDWAGWKKILRDTQGMIWDGTSDTFENARVVIPRTPGIRIDFEALQAARKVYQEPVDGFEDQNLPDMVKATFANPDGAKFDVNTGRPIQRKPAPKFDSQTGKPLAWMPGSGSAKFDPNTGEPIAPAKPTSFDPRTGQPIYASAGAGHATAAPPFPNVALF